MKKIVICSNANEESFKTLSEIEKQIDLTDCSVELLHIWSMEAYPIEDHHVAAFYPNRDQAQVISKTMKEKLEVQKERFKNINPENFSTEVRTSPSPKRAIVDYLKENSTDLVVVITPAKNKLKNFFHSSFTNYLTAHAPCDLLMIRQK
ncbi:MAG: universal stress protein [Bacteriovoracaceae bacterium]|nr:universal stress protein [Bacteriovoracaceae bacterium]